MCWAPFWAIFFTNSSGHPASAAKVPFFVTHIIFESPRKVLDFMIANGYSLCAPFHTTGDSIQSEFGPTYPPHHILGMTKV
jgi:hypothetical protein